MAGRWSTLVRSPSLDTTTVVAAHAAGGGEGRADPHIETMMGGGLQFGGPDQHVQPAVRGDGNVAGHRGAPVSVH